MGNPPPPHLRKRRRRRPPRAPAVRWCWRSANERDRPLVGRTDRLGAQAAGPQPVGQDHVQLGGVHRELREEVEPGQEADHHGKGAVGVAGAAHHPLQVPRPDHLQQVVAPAATRAPGTSDRQSWWCPVSTWKASKNTSASAATAATISARRTPAPRSPNAVPRLPRAVVPTSRAPSTQEPGQGAETVLQERRPLRDVDAPRLVAGVLARAHGTQPGPQSAEQTHGQRQAVARDLAHVVAQIGAQHRELCEGGVEQVLLEVGSVGQHEAEHRHEHQQEREDRQEPVVRHESCELAALVVTELLDHGEGHRRHGPSPLQVVELGHQGADASGRGRRRDRGGWWWGRRGRWLHRRPAALRQARHRGRHGEHDTEQRSRDVAGHGQGLPGAPRRKPEPPAGASHHLDALRATVRDWHDGARSSPASRPRIGR